MGGSSGSTSTVRRCDMNVVVAPPWEIDQATCSGLEPSNEVSLNDDWLLVRTISGTSGWAALDDERFEHLWLLGPGTTCGWLQADEPPASQSALSELRRTTELTWAQLAQALGVGRRSLHFWARGERPSGPNLERLMRVVGIVRSIDRGDPAQTTSRLLEPRGDGISLYRLMCEGRDAELLEIMSGGAPADRDQRGGRRRRPPRLSQTARDRRRGLSPVERVAAIQDEVSPRPGKLLASAEIPERPR